MSDKEHKALYRVIWAGGIKSSPHTVEQLIALVPNGYIKPDTIVVNIETEKKMPASSYDFLKEPFGEHQNFVDTPVTYVNEVIKLKSNININNTKITDKKNENRIFRKNVKRFILWIIMSVSR